MSLNNFCGHQRVYLSVDELDVAGQYGKDTSLVAMCLEVAVHLVGEGLPKYWVAHLLKVGDEVLVILRSPDGRCRRWW